MCLDQLMVRRASNEVGGYKGFKGEIPYRQPYQDIRLFHQARFYDNYKAVLYLVELVIKHFLFLISTKVVFLE